MRNGWAFAVLTLALVGSGLSARQADSEVTRFVTEHLPDSAAPGLAYARIADGEVTAGGFGEKRKGSGEPVMADTPFPIGSVTKSFTAVAIMQLAEEGNLTLDDPLSWHLPAFVESAASTVTLRQLLNHTSGYSTVQGNSQHGKAIAATLGLREYAAQLAKVVPARQPGETWEYSNTNYQLLGAVIEQASGESFPDYIERHIFEPLGMKNSAVPIGTVASGVASAHRPWFGSVRVAHGGEAYAINAPAGGIVSSAQDMGLYLAMWLNGEDDILPARAKSAMLEPSSPVSPAYGLGWSLDLAQGTAYHTGLVPGAETLASINLTEGKGVIVMVNANGGLGFADTWYLIGGVGARAMGTEHMDDGTRFGPQIAYLSIALLPPLFVLFAFVSWKRRARLRGKLANVAGMLALWSPLLAMGGLAWFVVVMLPKLFGGSLATLQLYQPDFAWCIIATAILAPAWAIFRLLLAYLANGKPRKG